MATRKRAPRCTPRKYSRRGPKDGTGPRAGTKACPKTPRKKK